MVFSLLKGLQFFWEMPRTTVRADALCGVPGAGEKRTPDLPSPTQNDILNAPGRNQISAFICLVEQLRDDNLLSLFEGF